MIWSKGEVKILIASSHCLPPSRASKSRMGKRPDLNNVFFRSTWEANYARYLNFLIKQNVIHKWEFEPDTFWFEEIKRGTRSYLPDFKIWEKQDSTPYYVEVKGYFDQESKTKLNRMKKYFPDVRIVMVTRKEYYQIKRDFSMIIPSWE